MQQHAPETHLQAVSFSFSPLRQQIEILARSRVCRLSLSQETMPSLQTALPPELANNLYRECLRRAKYIGHQIGNYVCSSPGIDGVEYRWLVAWQAWACWCCWLLSILYYKQHNTELLVNMVRQQFKRNKHEIDPEKIQKLKDDAARGLINHILYEAERLSGRRTIKRKARELRIEGWVMLSFSLGSCGTRSSKGKASRTLTSPWMVQTNVSLFKHSLQAKM
ncbi:hypothetical protein NC651_020243 [Populus alba x Populus x berolinensis]|nr:hypothetical protein NC651_020243 [Populus alba x Populus x berolinensis]